MSELPRTLERVIQSPVRLIRATEFFFRRTDASGDIYPDDITYGTIPGPDPDRVVFLGEAGQMSLGVRTHDLSIAAYFARHHRVSTDRGVSWALHAFPHARLADAPDAVAGASQELEGADIVVLMVGITDALRVITPSTWEQGLRRTFDALTEEVAPDARILVAEIPPLQNAGSLSRPARTAAGLHAKSLNRRTAAAAAGYTQVTVIPFPDELTRSLWRPESEEKRYTNTYDVWAGHLNRHLAPSATTP